MSPDLLLHCSALGSHNLFTVQHLGLSSAPSHPFLITHSLVNMGVSGGKISETEMAQLVAASGLKGMVALTYVRGLRKTGKLWLSMVSVTEHGPCLDQLSAARINTTVPDAAQGKDQSLDISAWRPENSIPLAALGVIDMGPLMLVQLIEVLNSPDVPAMCTWAPLQLTSNSLLFAGSMDHVSTLNGRLPQTALNDLGRLCNLDLGFSMALFNLWATMRAPTQWTSSGPLAGLRLVDFLWQFTCLAPLLTGGFTDSSWSLDWQSLDSKGKTVMQPPFQGGPAITSDLLVAVSLLYASKDILNEGFLSCIDGSCTDLLAYLALALAENAEPLAGVLRKCDLCKSLHFDPDSMPRPFRVHDVSEDLRSWAASSDDKAAVLFSIPRVMQLMQAHLTSALLEVYKLPWQTNNLGAILHVFKAPAINLQVRTPMVLPEASERRILEIWQYSNLISDEFASDIERAPRDGYSGESLISARHNLAMKASVPPPADWYAKGTHHVPHSSRGSVMSQPSSSYELSSCPNRTQHLLSDSSATYTLMPVPVLGDTLHANGVV